MPARAGAWSLVCSLVSLVSLVSLLACAGDDDSDAEVVCPPCQEDEICVVRCDGDQTPDASAECVPNPLGCPAEAGLCSAECEESLCGAQPSPYSCTSGTYCPRADGDAFYCQGS
ncbi:MAG TPA: hypothetical protein VK698_35950 [Kofleriaceae bacterium]|nr:hypothetical protein [Kofleriaceae bacterium]